MRMLRKLMVFAAVLVSCGSWAGSAYASHCWCEIATAWSDGTHNAAQLSLTSTVNTTYNATGNLCWGDDQCDKDRTDCSNRCNNACTGYVHSQSFANSLCANGVANGTVLKCYSHVGTRGWEANQTLGTLTNIAAVSKTVCTCPAPWTNGQNVVGGTTVPPDKNCKIQVCAPITPGPGTSLPPNMTGTGGSPSWWTWTNKLIETAPVANCVTTIVSPAHCALQ
jgi:hypothetical protein